MLIVANSFTFNGGSTLIIRLSREFRRRGKKVGVLILVNKIDPTLKNQLDEVADVYLLRDFINAPFKWSSNSQLGIFAPLNLDKLSDIAKKYGSHIHVMGIFGLLFFARMNQRREIKFGVSAGVYHQYEYMVESPSLLARYAQQLIKALGPQGLIFFNDANKESYSKFFDIDYTDALIVPIGIEISDNSNFKGCAKSYKIVSVGNLYPFKTYNLHIIRLMPKLLEINTNFTYEIYGDGELLSEAKALIHKLKLQDKVFLKGRIPYKQFPDVLNDSFLFVGSGTAILEASSLGIPSIVGIESISKPVTFGYLSDIDGSSYNEFDDSRRTVQIYGLIEKIAQNEATWHKVSEACKAKATQFSIKHTADGFEKLENNKNIIFNDEQTRYRNINLCCSFLWLALIQLLRIDDSFSQRRHKLAKPIFNYPKTPIVDETKNKSKP